MMICQALLVETHGTQIGLAGKCDILNIMLNFYFTGNNVVFVKDKIHLCGLCGLYERYISRKARKACIH